jgi:uncharacterized protein
MHNPLARAWLLGKSLCLELISRLVNLKKDSHMNQQDTNSQTQSTSGISQDSKNLAVLLWVISIFFMFIPGLVVYLLKQDDAYLFDQSKEALNWGITAALGYLAGSILMIVLIGGLVMAAVGICHLVFCIMGVIATSNGQTFRVPFALRLIK